MTTYVNANHSTTTTVGILWASGIALVWIVAAIVRPDTTLHLGPLLVPLLPAIMMDGSRRAVAATMVAIVIGLGATALLAATGHLSGPAIRPFPDALTETLVLLALGAFASLGVVSLRGADVGD